MKMMFICFSDRSGNEYWVNPKHIVSVHDDQDMKYSGGSIVALSNGKWIECSESADVITDHILRECE